MVWRTGVDSNAMESDLRFRSSRREKVFEFQTPSTMPSIHPTTSTPTLRLPPTILRLAPSLIPLDLPRSKRY